MGTRVNSTANKPVTPKDPKILVWTAEAAIQTDLAGEQRYNGLVDANR